MKKIGIGIDYSNICKDYNTAYLDRDNKDPQTAKCMRAVLGWTKEFVTDLLNEFGYKICKLSTPVAVEIDEVASNRFLFYSLEKAITLQNYLFTKEYVEYDSLGMWETQAQEGVLIMNDEDGEGLYLYFNEGSAEQVWITNRLKDFALDEVPFQSK